MGGLDLALDSCKYVSFNTVVLAVAVSKLLDRELIGLKSHVTNTVGGVTKD